MSAADPWAPSAAHSTAPARVPPVPPRPAGRPAPGPAPPRTLVPAPSPAARGSLVPFADAQEIEEFGDFRFNVNLAHHRAASGVDESAAAAAVAAVAAAGATEGGGGEEEEDAGDMVTVLNNSAAAFDPFGTDDVQEDGDADARRTSYGGDLSKGTALMVTADAAEWAADGPPPAGCESCTRLYDRLKEARAGHARDVSALNAEIGRLTQLLSEAMKEMAADSRQSAAAIERVRMDSDAQRAQFERELAATRALLHARETDLQEAISSAERDRDMLQGGIEALKMEIVRLRAHPSLRSAASPTPSPSVSRTQSVQFVRSHSLNATPSPAKDAAESEPHAATPTRDAEAPARPPLVHTPSTQSLSRPETAAEFEQVERHLRSIIDKLKRGIEAAEERHRNELADAAQREAALEAECANLRAAAAAERASGATESAVQSGTSGALDETVLADLAELAELRREHAQCAAQIDALGTQVIALHDEIAVVTRREAEDRRRGEEERAELVHRCEVLTSVAEEFAEEMGEAKLAKESLLVARAKGLQQLAIYGMRSKKPAARKNPQQRLAAEVVTLGQRLAEALADRQIEVAKLTDTNRAKDHTIDDLRRRITELEAAAARHAHDGAQAHGSAHGGTHTRGAPALAQAATAGGLRPSPQASSLRSSSGRIVMEDPLDHVDLSLDNFRRH